MNEVINDGENLNSNNNNSINQSKTQLLNFDSDDILSQTTREENIRQLVADCRKELIDGIEDCYGSWALINYAE